MMKRLFAILLALALILGCCPVIPLQAKAAGEESRELTAADYAQVDLVFDKIEEAQAAPAKKNDTDSQKTETAMEIVLASDSYVEGSLVQSGNVLTWWTDSGIRCMYSPRMQEIQKKQTPETSVDAIVNEPVAKKGGSPQSNEVYLIGPYYGSDENFTDQYKEEATRVAAAIGDTDGYTLYSGEAATIDKVAEAISNGAVVFFDSHGATDYQNSKNKYDEITGATCSYLCLSTAAGLTNADYQDGAAYNGKTAFVNGETIVNHMTKNSPHGLLWMAICLGMGTDGLYAPLRNKGVEVVYGYSESVTFQGDYLFEETFWGEMVERKTVAQSVATMKEKWGDWDLSEKIADYYGFGDADTYSTIEEARGDFIAFPVVVSGEDPWPGQRKSDSEYGADSLQEVCSTYTLLQTCEHTNAYATAEQPATCTEDGYTAGVYCPDCHWYVSGHAVIPAAHQYEDGACAVCGEAQTPEIEIGEGGILIDASYYPESSHNYLPGRIETQTFTCPGAEKLVITFSYQTQVEQDNDYISVYDGNNALIAKFTGTEASGKTVTIPGESFSIKLESDFSGEYYGYSLSAIVAYMATCQHTFGDWIVETAATNTTTGLKYRICSACGQQENKVIPQILRLSGAALTLSDSIQLNVNIKKATIDQYGYIDAYLEVVLNGNTFILDIYRTSGDNYVFGFNGLTPAMLGDTMQITLYAKNELYPTAENGGYYKSTTTEYSVWQYCQAQLNKTSAGAKLKTMLVDMLNYGTAAQKYVNYKTDDLVSDKMTAAQKALGTQVDTPAVNEMNQAEDNATPTVLWKGGRLSLGDRVAVVVTVQAASLEDLTIVMTTAYGTEFIYTAEDLKPLSGYTDRYTLEFGDLGVGQMREKATFVAYQNGEQVSRTLTYSIQSYVASKGNGTDALAVLLREMLKYGDAAKAYVS